MPRPQGLRRTRQTEVIAFGGGIDLQTPANARQPGTLLDCKNFTVPPTGGGYERFKGLQKYDGRTVSGEAGSPGFLARQPVRSLFTFGGKSYALAEKSDLTGLVSYHTTNKGWVPTRSERSPDEAFCIGFKGVYNSSTSSPIGSFYPSDLRLKWTSDGRNEFVNVSDYLTQRYSDPNNYATMNFNRLMYAHRWLTQGNPYMFFYTYTYNPSDRSYDYNLDKAGPFYRGGSWGGAPSFGIPDEEPNPLVDNLSDIDRVWSNEQWQWMAANPNQLLPYGHLFKPPNKVLNFDRRGVRWRTGEVVDRDQVDGVDIIDSIIYKRLTPITIPTWSIFEGHELSVNPTYLDFDHQDVWSSTWPNELHKRTPDPNTDQYLFYNYESRNSSTGRLKRDYGLQYKYPFDQVMDWGQSGRDDGGILCFSTPLSAVRNFYDDADGALVEYERVWRIDSENYGRIRFAFLTDERYESIGYDHVHLGSRRIEVKIGNFYGDLDRQRAYIVTGLNRAHEFDGQEYVPIMLFGADEVHLDRPTHVAVHGLHLWLATKGGQLHYSQTGNPTKFGGATSGVIGVGDEITGLVGDYQGSMIVFCRNRTFMLTGREEEDFELRQISNNSGALPGSVQMGESPVCMDDRGVRLVTATDTFGDLALGTVSERIHPLIDMLRGVRIAASVIVRESNQYWLIYDNGEVLVMTWVVGQDGVNVQWSRLNFNRMLGSFRITCAWSGEDADGNEIVLLGSDNGNVYQANKGNDFDGVPIDGYLVVACRDMKQPNMIKKFYRIEVDVVAQGNCSFRHGVHRDHGQSYGSIGDANVAGMQAQLQAVGNLAVLRASDPGFPRVSWVSSVDNVGLARNIDYVATTGYDDNDARDPFSITGLSVDWGPRKNIF